ncbi:MAG: glycosyltransferase family 2 protein [Muribaculaceae bacterium]|nr:glycosyltransferase family 2 protein [Muribaculaceae bacterium]
MPDGSDAHGYKAESNAQEGSAGIKEKQHRNRDRNKENMIEEMVSIIVPVYKASPYLAETIETVRKQTYHNWELILVDDASPDDSAEVICKIAGAAEGVRRVYQGYGGGLSEERFEGKECIRLIRKTQNEGAARARNTGIELAEGRYIAFLDADDIWAPDKLEKELAFLHEKQAAFVFTAYEFGDERAHGTGRIVKVPDKLTYRKALSRTVIFTTTVLFDRQKIDKELMRMPTVESEDTATWWKILRAGYVAYGLNEPLAIYRRPAKSLSSNKVKAVKRIWNLYRREEGLTIPVSAFYFCFWALRATLRRI